MHINSILLNLYLYEFAIKNRKPKMRVVLPFLILKKWPIVVCFFTNNLAAK